MRISKLFKDITLLPVDLILDIVGVNPLRKAFDKNYKSIVPFGTFDRIHSMLKNLIS